MSFISAVQPRSDRRARLLLSLSSAGAAILLGLALSSCVPAQAQAIDPYLALVRAYRGSERDAVSRLRAMTVAETETAVRLATDGGPEPWDWRDLRAAAMLHTEAWYSARAGAADEAARHAELAERLLGAATAREPQQLYFAERWCQTVALLLRADRNAAASIRDRCRRRWLLTAPALMARGRYFQAVGREAQFFASRQYRMAPRTDPEVQQHIRILADIYKEALAEDPHHAAAALRLGNLRAWLGEDAPALESFTLASRSYDPGIRYLAFLFIGAIHDRNGRLAEAERFYRAAMPQYPSAQSAAFALAELLGRSGREAESNDVLLGALSTGVGRRVDPLWTFRLPPEVGAGLQLDELRIEVTQ